MYKASSFNLLYTATLLVHLSAIFFHLDILCYISKFLLPFILAAYFITGTEGIPAIFRISLLAALLLSGFGDMFLLFSEQSTLFFTCGLFTFMLSLLSYIGFFLKIRYTNYPLPLCKWPFILGMAAGIIAFIFFMLPYLGQMTLPVLFFAVTAYIMLQSVMHAFRLGEQPSGWYSLAGACLYIVSCTLIAIHYFYRHLEMGTFFIMLTYGIAQWGLVTGGLRYLQMRRGYAVPQ
ncbi:lysoplasmalogenase [Chitinophaga filiformis]|uniref:lysoplasmalogenase family protein n=1 Tax=Chitinophaga filiformis TaxID=104663 RepID=UPI001F280620|nr:lysoplasmalogenase family protein [Chitinophaga filiformis]MCF6402089.1 lysoplasmalogenase [Chitinophaga filiformis]